MHVAEIEQGAVVEDGQPDAVADRRVTDVEVAAPFALAVEAGADLAIGGDAQRADERRDRPGELVAEVQRAVARGAAGTGAVAEDLGGVSAGQLGPARRFAERA